MRQRPGQRGTQNSCPQLAASCEARDSAGTRDAQLPQSAAQRLPCLAFSASNYHRRTSGNLRQYESLEARVLLTARTKRRGVVTTIRYCPHFDLVHELEAQCYVGEKSCIIRVRYGTDPDAFHRYMPLARC